MKSLAAFKAALFDPTHVAELDKYDQEPNYLGSQDYGRVMRDHRGRVAAIVEHKDATPEQREVRAELDVALNGGAAVDYDFGDVETAFKESHYVREEAFTGNNVFQSPLEPSDLGFDQPLAPLAASAADLQRTFDAFTADRFTLR